MLNTSLPINYEIRDTYTQKYLPEQNNFGLMNEISFLILDTDKSWVDLNSIYLEIKCKFIKHDDTNFGDTDLENAYLENNLFHTLWESINLEINGNPVRGSEIDYSYKSYIMAITQCTEDEYSERNHFEQFYPHNEGEDLDQIPIPAGAHDDIKNANNSVNKRQKYQTRLSKPFNMLGKLNVDLLKQGRALPPGHSLKIILTKKKPEFYVRSTGNDIHKLSILNMTLYVKKMTLQDNVQVEYSKALHQKGLGLFPILRTATYAQTVPNGVDITIPRFITGPIPRRVIVGFVKNLAKSGSVTLNPFKFCDMNIKEIFLVYDGKDYPTKHYLTDFGANKSRLNLTAYKHYRDVMYPLDSEPGKVYLTYNRWLEGHTLFAFDMTPDLSGPTGEFYRTPPRSGDITLEIRRTADDNQNWNAIVFLEFHSEISLRHMDGKVIVDW